MLIRSAPDSSPRSAELSRRLRALIGVVVLAFAVLVGRLWQLQIVRGDQYYEQTRENVVDQRFLPAVRGKILDRFERPIADNRPAFNLYATPKKVDAAELERLAALLELGEEERARARERLEAGRERDPRRPVLLLEDQGRERASLVRQEHLAFPGVEVRDEPYRHYPNGSLAAHLVGYMNQINAEELAKLSDEGYEPSEQIGRYGLERKWENYLRGTKGVERFVVNARGQRVEGEEAEGLIEGPKFEPPVAGHNVVLTLDLDLQKLVEKELSAHAAGAVAVVEVDTGRVLALASTPSFDPNVMTGHLTRAQLAQLTNDPRKPFIDKTLRQHYPPGSTYKFVPALAALEAGIVGEHETLSCPGYFQAGRRSFRCNSFHEKVDIREALQHSCNVYFWKVADRLGMDPLAEIAREFGFGAPTGLGLNGDVSGRVPTRAWYEERGYFTSGYTLNAAIGQGDVEVGVLQLAMAYAAIANGGDLYVPQVVERIESPDGDVAVQYEPIQRRHVAVSSRSLEIVREGMYKVVNEPGGTAYRHARSELVPYAGKTGTAQVRSMRRGEQIEVDGWDPRLDHAWFAGFAPYDDPEIAFVVLIEHGGGHGGDQAGPVALAIVEGYLADKKTAALDEGAKDTPRAARHGSPAQRLARGAR